MKTSRATLLSLIARAESAIGLGDFDVAATLIADARAQAHAAYPAKFAQEALVDLARLRVELTLAARVAA